jgi:uncharacterized protein
MKVALLDANILVALLWPAQESHQKAQNWFQKHAAEGWATCPLTQSAFVRTVTNPVFSTSAVSMKQATEVLRDCESHPTHEFWPADVSYFDAIEALANRIVGYRQVTDAYLLGLVLHHRGSFVTMDRGILHLVPPKLQGHGLVTLI